MDQSPTTAEAFGITVIATVTKHYSVWAVFEAGPLFFGQLCLTEQISDLWKDREPLRIPFHDTLQREVAQAVGEALLPQLHVSTTWDAGEHHHQRRALLTPAPRIRPVSRRAGHGR